ncbi:unnamed protein product [Rotaria sp. Silwood2]|nr:unnamed protein product [Rotaria sp. Silwood2]CAF4409064.1 unnamed protein product [Rotaria sp. Silwood2]
MEHVMGTIDSKSTYDNNYSNIIHLKNSNCFSSFSCHKSLTSSYYQENDENCFCHFYNKQRLCSKKKVLVLDLDEVGTTDLFIRLICQNKHRFKIDSSPQLTIAGSKRAIRSAANDGDSPKNLFHFDVGKRE